MTTFRYSVRRTLGLSLLAFGLVAANFAQASSTPQSVGPRNTIPGATAAARSPAERTSASTDESSVCQAVRLAHYGHPGKGVDRIETTQVPCDRSRVAKHWAWM